MTTENIQSQVAGWLLAAGELILNLSVGGISAELKADFTPVTAIDHTVEKFLRERIMEAYPTHGIIGEEMPSHLPEALERWLIDPIDGTRALMAGFSSYTILLALAQGSSPRYGAMYQPITKEFWWGDCHTQTATLNGSPIRTRLCEQIDKAFFSTTSPLLFRAEDQPRIIKLMQRCKAYQLGGDGYAYAKLASGHIDLIIESGLKPYDFMALIPVIEGAGGIITDWQGHPLTLESSGDVCAAGDKKLHEYVIKELRL
jgi:inositol-phosphate phosphatase/L-galactose 1-phosphate phosphatase/histidinol-phosphatase